MPEKDGDEGKSTKSVVNKKQKQMMGEEGYDIARDMGKVRPSKDKKDATTMPVSDEVKKTQKVNTGPSAFERVKAKYGKSVMNVGKKKVNEELDLTKVAEALGGYIVEDIKSESEKEKEALQKAKDKKMRELEAQERLARKGTLGKDDETSRQGRIDARQGGKGATSFDTFDPTDEGEKPIPGRTPLGDVTKGGKVTVSKIGDKPKEGIVARTRRLKAQADKKQRISTALQGREDMEDGERRNINPRKQGTPVEIETQPVTGAGSRKQKEDDITTELIKKRFASKASQRAKTFKQGFGRKTGADYVTGKPTYMRPGVLGKDGKPRKAQKRSKLLPDFEQTKRTIDMGLNPDESDKNQFIDQDVRNKRMDDLGTPDPFDPDYDKKVKKVDGRTKIGKKIKKAFTPPKFQTVQRPMEVDKETQPDTEKMGGQLVKSKRGFKDFDRIMRDAKVDADIERTIAGSGGGRKTKIGTGTASDPEVVKNGRAKNARDVTALADTPEPSAFSQAKDRISDFTKKNPVAALATYDLGKGILGKIMKKARIPNVPTPRAIRVSAKS